MSPQQMSPQQMSPQQLSSQQMSPQQMSPQQSLQYNESDILELDTTNYKKERNERQSNIDLEFLIMKPIEINKRDNEEVEEVEEDIEDDLDKILKDNEYKELENN